MKRLESETIEFKKSTAQLKEAVISLCAMLNKHGSGVVYFGIKDDGTVCGQEIGKKTTADVSHEFRNNLKPIPTITISVEQLGGKNVEKHHFFNPIWQNRGHISNLNRILKYKVPLFSAVVFSDRSELKNVEYDPSDCEIMHTSGVSSYLANMRRYMDDALSEEEVDRIYEKLLPYTTVTRQEKEDHVNRILYEQQNIPKCPYCGSNLVIRTARSGPRAGKQFFGCSNYPKCRYLQNID